MISTNTAIPALRSVDMLRLLIEWIIPADSPISFSGGGLSRCWVVGVRRAYWVLCISPNSHKYSLASMGLFWFPRRAPEIGGLCVPPKITDSALWGLIQFAIFLQPLACSPLFTLSENIILADPLTPVRSETSKSYAFAFVSSSSPDPLRRWLLATGRNGWTPALLHKRRRGRHRLWVVHCCTAAVTVTDPKS